MGPRRWLAGVALAALAVCAGAGCGKDKGEAAGGAGEAGSRCEQLAKACGDQPKHVEKLVAECTQAGKQQAEKRCSAQATAAYDCYQKELCGGSDKVWALDDFRVLAERHGKCVAERDALRACVGE